MTFRTHYLAAAAAIGALAVPAAAQTAYPYGAQPSYPQYQQPYTPQQAYPAYQQPSYGQPAYNQGYGQNPVSTIIDSLLGNRYNVTDRQAVSQCASAAMAQAASQYGGYGNGYGNGYGHDAYRSGYGGGLRVTSITDVQRRSNGLQVKGLMSSGGGYNGQYQNRGYAGGELTFRCNVDYRGAVTNIRIGRNGHGR